MPLRVLDGNQTATTLSSVITGGEHIVAHSVVSFGALAIQDIAGAVSGSVVTIPSLARILNSAATDGVSDTTLNFIKIGGHQDGSNQTAHIVHVSAGGAMKVDATDSSVTFGAIRGTVTIGNFPSTQTIAGTVTANVSANIQNEVANGLNEYAASYNDPLPISLPVGVASLPISGTVTANAVIYNVEEAYDEAINQNVLAVHVKDLSGNVLGSSGSPLPISGTVTAHLVDLSENIIPLDFSALDNDSIPNRGVQIGWAHTNDGAFYQVSDVNPLPISGTVTVGNSVTIGSFATSVTARLVDPTGTAVSYASTGTAGNPSSDVISIQGVSGGTSVPVSISSVTIGAVPNGALTTRFGSVTTANTAQISSAVTNASRKYLLVQNVTTSSNVITIGIGFTPTTTQGIQLSAGGGITFESSYIPTGAVYILSSVTASPFTILEA